MSLKNKADIPNYEEKAKFLRSNGWQTWYHDDNWVEDKHFGSYQDMMQVVLLKLPMHRKKVWGPLMIWFRLNPCMKKILDIKVGPPLQGY